MALASADDPDGELIRRVREGGIARHSTNWF